VNVLGAEAVAQALRMLEVLDRQHPDAREALASNAWSELTTWDEIQLRLVPDSQTDDRCSVAGGYVHSTTPPTLTVTNSLSPGRRSFTVLHELGHHLQRNDIPLARAVRDQRADTEAFEDAACDAFAARILITDNHLAAVLTDRSPTAATLVRLFEVTEASRAACCARVIDYLGTNGIIAVLDDTGHVRFARGHGDVFAPARGTDQSATPLVKAALNSTTGAQHDNTYFTYRTGTRSAEMYGDAAWAGDYLMVVTVLDRPGWKAFAPSRDVPRPYVPRLDGWCEICQESFTVTDRCTVCRQGRCPGPGHCGCSVAKERTCGKCFLRKHASQFPSSAATTCKECSA
jgi:Zn-dependent peptidase ImmA (M78 family)